MPCSMSSTWNPDLVKSVHEVIAAEIRILGASITFSPNINLYTDPRFGRFQGGRIHTNIIISNSICWYYLIYV